MAIILRTENGPHPADAWAMVTAQQIVDYDQQLSTDKLAKAQELREQVARVLQPHFEKVQTEEQSKLAADSAAIASPLVIEIADAVGEVLAKLIESLWADHFKRPEVQDVVRDTIQRNMNTIAYIERSWHADRNPDHPAVAAFRGQ